MVLKARSLTVPAFSRLVSLSICLFVLAVLPLPELVILASAEASEGGCPRQEDRESSEEELVVWSSARRRFENRRQVVIRRPVETINRHCQTAADDGRLPSVVGQQLSNGLCAPLLV